MLKHILSCSDPCRDCQLKKCKHAKEKPSRELDRTEGARKSRTLWLQVCSNRQGPQCSLLQTSEDLEVQFEDEGGKDILGVVRLITSELQGSL